MPSVAFSSNNFCDLLPLYYRRLFPYQQFFEWVTYGDENSKCFQNREFSFTLENDVYVRYQSFENVQDLEIAIKKDNPHKIDIGAIFDLQPRHHKRVPLIPQEKELVFDIDMTDYDDVRSCCQGADVCKKCWRFMAIACKVLDKALREDFGYTHLLWVFSGRRGIHCWVCDKKALQLDNLERAAIAGYLQNDTTRYQNPKRDRMHPALRRAYNLIEPEFVNFLMEEQDALGTEDKVKKLVEILPQELAKDLLGKLMSLTTSVDRWNAVVSHIKQFHDESSANKGLHQFAEQELVLRYAYPRLDINVSTGLNHLLKAPFCVHPKSGKVCVPFNPKTVDKFDPAVIPTLAQLVEEIRVFDEKEKVFTGKNLSAASRDKAAEPGVDSQPGDVQMDETEPTDGTEPMDTSMPPSSEEGPSAVPSNGNADAVETSAAEDSAAEEAPKAAQATHTSEKSVHIKDFKKTSMYKGILVFETFLRMLKAARQTPAADIEDDWLHNSTAALPRRG